MTREMQPWEDWDQWNPTPAGAEFLSRQRKLAVGLDKRDGLVRRLTLDEVQPARDEVGRILAAVDALEEKMRKAGISSYRGEFDQIHQRLFNLFYDMERLLKS